MPEQPQSIDLDDSKHQRIQHWEWIAERVGWVLIASILVAGGLGLIGPGIFSHRQAMSSDGRLRIEYHRIQRNEAPCELLIQFERPSADQDAIRLAISRAFTDATTIESLVPEPDAVEMQADRLVYTFLISGPARDGKVVLRYQNHRIGSLRYDMALDAGANLSLSHFVCP